MTKKQLAEKAIVIMEEYKKLSDHLWNQIQTGRIHGHHANLMVGGCAGYNKLESLLRKGINSPIVKKMKKDELIGHIAEIEQNMEAIKKVIGGTAP